MGERDTMLPLEKHEEAPLTSYGGIYMGPPASYATLLMPQGPSPRLQAPVWSRLISPGMNELLLTR